jgi:hypothetical protein
MPLQELRHARNLSKEQLAQILSLKQAAVSKLEKWTDMYISILRYFIKAMGVDLEIIATFFTQLHANPCFSIQKIPMPKDPLTRKNSLPIFPT